MRGDPAKRGEGLIRFLYDPRDGAVLDLPAIEGSIADEEGIEHSSTHEHPEVTRRRPGSAITDTTSSPVRARSAVRVSPAAPAGSTSTRVRPYGMTAATEPRLR